MKQKTASVMRPIVEAYGRYKGSKKAFCEEHGLALHTLNYWLGKLTSELGVYTPRRPQPRFSKKVLPLLTSKSLRDADEQI